MNYREYLQGIFPDYEVTEESNYNYDGEKTVVVIKYLGGGSNYKGSKVQPVQVTFYSPDIPTARSAADTFAHNYTNVAFRDDLEYVEQYYSTPVVLTQFQPVGNNHNGQVIVDGTLIISSNVSEIKTVAIDEYEYETTTRKISYTTHEDTQRRDDGQLGKTNIKSSVLQFTCTMINRNNDVCTKARRVRTGSLNRDTDFTVKLTFSDNDTPETYTMKLHDFVLDSENGKLPMITMTFIQ